MELLFRVDGQLIERLDDEILAEDSCHYLCGWVVFESGWEDIEHRELLFEGERDSIKIELDRKNSFDESANLTFRRGIYYVSAVGTNSTGSVIRTTPLQICVRASGGR